MPMSSTHELLQKYQRLQAECAKLQSQNGILKKAVAQEQARTARTPTHAPLPPRGARAHAHHIARLPQRSARLSTRARVAPRARTVELVLGDGVFSCLQHLWVWVRRKNHLLAVELQRHLLSVVQFPLVEGATTYADVDLLSAHLWFVRTGGGSPLKPERPKLGRAVERQVVVVVVARVRMPVIYSDL